jgi:anti-sigma regulatory factor (Ser/Thr protein kinase)
MPLNALPAEGFLNRETELSYLKGLSGLKGNALGGNVLLEGARGIGKTELLRQHYRSLFRETAVVPFYYCFRTGNLKGTYFARDYFTAFVRQYLAFTKNEPFLTGGAAEPLPRLLPAISSLGLHWLVDSVEAFQEHLKNNDVYWQIVTAISLPVVAARQGGKPVLVMLDDFDAAEDLYESSLGDAPSLVSLFGESLRSPLCAHVMTGSAGALETIFTDRSLIGLAERMRLGPLPEDLAADLFRRHLSHLEMTIPPAEQLKFLSTLQGNPLYLRNLAKALWKMRKLELTERDLIEGYSYEISDGETAFYWSSALSRAVKNPARRRAILQWLLRFLEGGGMEDGGRPAVMAGAGEAETLEALETIRALGMTGGRDAVLHDVLRCLYMREVEGRKAGEAREKIEAQYLAKEAESCFEMVIPMSSNAELVVAKAVEQIGKNIDLDEEFLNYLQLALIEVCINAIEHSGSYDKKVFLKFIMRSGRLEIIVENTGRPFSLDARKDLSAEEKLRLGIKRGWGFKLVYSIMDDVKIERVNDRTRVILTKYIKDKEVQQ